MCKDLIGLNPEKKHLDFILSCPVTVTDLYFNIGPHNKELR